MAGLQRLTKYFSRATFNALPDHAERQIAAQHGRGVLQGLEITIHAGGGLKIDISAGIVNGICTRAIGAISGAVVPPDAATFIWIDDTGFVQYSGSSGDIGGGFSCLGKVTTNSSAIITITDAGRMMPSRVDAVDPRVHRIGRAGLVVDGNTGRVGIGRFPTADCDIAGDLAVSGDHTVEGSASVLGGLACAGSMQCSGQTSAGVRVLTLAGTHALSIDDANYQVLDPDGVTRQVLLPPDMSYQHSFRIACAGTSGRLDVVGADGVTVVKTINPGEVFQFIAKPNGGGGLHLGDPGGAF